MLVSLDPSRLSLCDDAKSAEIRAGDLDFGTLLAIARRQYKIVLLSLAFAFVLAAAYLAVAPRKYTAVTQILIDSKKNTGLSGADTTLADLNIESEAVDSQVELLKATKIMDDVLDQLGKEDPSINALRSPASGPSGGIPALLSAVWPSSTTPFAGADTDLYARQIRMLEMQRNLDIHRVGHSYMIEIAYTGSSPGQAADVSNAFAKAYLRDQTDANFEVTRRAGDWLLSRLHDLKEKSLASDLAVQKFRAANGLIAAKDGVLVNDQQLTELNSQLMAARGDVAEAAAKFDRIRAIIQSGSADQAVSETIANPVIVDLRTKYLTASKQEAEISKRFGADHLQAVRLRGEMTEYERLIFDEVTRIAESYKSALHIAEAREAALELSLKKQEGVTGLANEQLVTLRELDRSADSYRTLYETLLRRYQETVQKQSFPVSEARIVSPAAPPITPSSPHRAFVLALAGVLGLLAGSAIATVREIRDRGFRTSKQVRDRLGLEFLGMLPLVEPGQIERAAGVPREPVSPNTRSIATSSAIMRYSVVAPLSSFTEALRGIKVALDTTLGDKPTKIIGIVSVLPNEGKSTVSKNFASLLAHLGMRTLLIDADLRNPGLTRILAPKAEKGLVEVLKGERQMRDLSFAEPDSGLTFLPSVAKDRITHTSELLASQPMRQLLDELGQYEFIIIDLPPLGPVIDAKAAAKLVDAFVFVVEWGATARDFVATTLATEPQIAEKCAGVLLNKVDMTIVGRYQSDALKEYYYSRYGNYYGGRKAIKAMPIQPPGRKM